MADDDSDRKSELLDVAGAVLLGVTTALAAYGAYEGSLYGGNQATAYTQAINTLGEANRESLQGMQERTFDTTVWLEHMKAQEAAQATVAKEEAAAAAAAAPAEGAAPGAAPTAAAAPAAAEEEEEEKPQTKDEAAAELADALTEVGDLSLDKKMDKLLTTRRELTAALKWAEQEHDKTTKKMPKEKRLEISKKVVDLGEKMEKKYEEQFAILLKLVPEDEQEDEEAIAAAVEKNPDAKGKIAKLDEEIAALDKEASDMIDKLAKPLFFESTAYSKNQTRKSEELLEKGNKLFEEGSKANEIGDKFTLATVFYTVALFFAGLSPVMRRFPIKAAFLGMALAVAVAASAYMFRLPLI